MAQIVLGMFLHQHLIHLLLHNLSVDVLAQFMDAVLIVQHQNITKLAQIVLGMFLRNLSVVVLVQFMDAVPIVMYQNITKLAQIVLYTHHLLLLRLPHLLLRLPHLRLHLHL
jgi:hypothetical protein